MKRILFICSGNMYRSAGAEFILRQKLSEAGIDDWIADSAGTLQLNRTGRPEDFGRILAEKGYEFGRGKTHVDENEPASEERIIVMEPNNQ